MSYLIHLLCPQCNNHFDSAVVQTFCQNCQSPLLPQYNLTTAADFLEKEQIKVRSRGTWRWRELLPVLNPDYMLSLGEGDTPLLPQIRLGKYLGLRNLYLKEEGLNPTGSFKARGLAVAVSRALELGINRLIIPTAGNAGGALAAYAALGGVSATIIMPKDTPAANLIESRMAGASIELIDGLISDAGKSAAQKALNEGWFDVSTFKEPYRVEGKKIMGYELAETFNWHLPDVIIYPTGGGTGLVGMWKAFNELKELGWLKTDILPRFVAVQAVGCAPVVRAFESGASTCEYWARASTLATGLRVPKSFADRLILKVLKESKGIAIAVSDQEIIKAQRLLATLEGIFACPEGAATLAALKKLVDAGWVKSEEQIILFNTGTGLKYLDRIDTSITSEN